jgi:hypothetical protein
MDRGDNIPMAPGGEGESSHSSRAQQWPGKHDDDLRLKTRANWSFSRPNSKCVRFGDTDQSPRDPTNKAVVSLWNFLRCAQLRCRLPFWPKFPCSLSIFPVTFGAPPPSSAPRMTIRALQLAGYWNAKFRRGRYSNSGGASAHYPLCPPKSCHRSYRYNFHTSILPSFRTYHVTSAIICVSLVMVGVLKVSGRDFSVVEIVLANNWWATPAVFTKPFDGCNCKKYGQCNIVYLFNKTFPLSKGLRYSNLLTFSVKNELKIKYRILSIEKCHGHYLYR